MAKAYSEFMDEITSDELYQGLLAYGLFSEKLPPVFDATGFYDYSLSLPQPFSKHPHGYIYYEAMPYNKLQDEWKTMKQQGVSFIKKEFRR